MAWFVRFTATEWLSDVSDYATLRISVEIIPREKYKSPTEPLYMKYATLDANISSSLRRKWNLERPALEAELLEYARRKITDELQSDRFSDQIAFLLTTNDAPAAPAFRPSPDEMQLPLGFEVSKA